MEKDELIEELLKTSNKQRILNILENNSDFVNVNFAEELKNTYYDSWTKEPQKTRNAAVALTELSNILPDVEIKALAEWVSGIANLTEGKLEKTVTDLDKAAELFRKIGKEHEAAQTQVAKLTALAFLGRYKEAILNGKSALKTFEKFGNELAAGKIEKNIGNIFVRQGNRNQAENYFFSARKRFVKIGDKSELAMCDNGIANLYAESNNFQKAEKFYKSALENARETGMAVTEAEIEGSIGNLATFRGKYADALRFLEVSQRKYERLQMPHQITIANLEIADIYLELNLADEAFSIYKIVADEFQKLKLQSEEARTRANFGRAAMVLGKTEKAQKELKKSARLYKNEANKIGTAIVKIALANLELTRKRYKNVFKFAEEVETLLQDSGNLRLQFAAKWLKGEALGKTGKFGEAEQILTQNYVESLKQEQKNIAQISLNSLGNIFLQTNNVRLAEKHFKKAVKIIESLRAPLAGEEFRMSFLADKLAPFENLAKIYLSENKLKDAFLMIEKSRARTLSETLQNDLTTNSQAKGSPKIIKELEKLREELNWFYNRLNRGEETELTELQAETTKREKQISNLLRQIESTNNAKTSKNYDADFDLKILQKTLGENKVLIEFVKFDEYFSAFVITDKKINFVKNLVTESEIIELLEGLHFQFGTLRYGAKVSGKFAAELKKRTDFYLRKFYDKLFLPLEKFVEQRNLIIIPANSIYYVPFQALRDGENYLIESHEISYAPSATVWNFLQQKQRRNLKNALLIGFADERIPLVNQEIKTLQEIFPSAKTFTGEDANFSAFTENAKNFDILHLACHGQFRPENPLFSSLHLADGNITVRDICANKIKAGLVTLSACETGLSKIFAGDEILGLARGFLSAGANSLVLSLWTVNDEATTELMKDFYTNLQRGATVAASLRQAQKEFIERNEHPYFWSSFSMIGK